MLELKAALDVNGIQIARPPGVAVLHPTGFMIVGRWDPAILHIFAPVGATRRPNANLVLGFQHDGVERDPIVGREQLAQGYLELPDAPGVDDPINHVAIVWSEIVTQHSSIMVPREVIEKLAY